MAGKDCPMCGETMRLRERQITSRVPGTAQTHTSQQREWICPECDYFEEVDE
jgi:acetone carboxylase gamma subunit